MSKVCKYIPAQMVTLLLLGICLMSGCAVQSASYPVPGLPTDSDKPYVEPSLEPDAPEAGLSKEDLATPDLIELAFVRSEIDAGQRLLYLAYAVYEYESLPEEFHSDVPWRGTLIVRDLKQSVTSQESLCALTPDVQAEMRRLISESAACSP